MGLRLAAILVAVTLMGAACSGTAIDEAPDAAATTSVAGATTDPAPATPTDSAGAGDTGDTDDSPDTADSVGAATADSADSVDMAATAESADSAGAATSEPEASEPAMSTAPPARAEGVGDSFYPFLGNGGYDVLHYNITMSVDTESREISALVGITARATEDLQEFNLDLAGLDVLAVVVANPDGSDPVDAEFTRYRHELTVDPGRVLAEGAAFTASVLYTGWPAPIDDPVVPFAEVGWHQQDGVIYTASEPSGSMTWFPSNNHPTDKATFRIKITVPEGLVAASNGRLVEETTSNGRTTFVWRMDDPMATYLAAVYIGDFERVEHGPLYPDGPVIRDYVPSDAPPEIAAALAVTPEVIAFLEDLLGPYPFDAYGTIVMPFPLGFALENQTLSLHGLHTIDPGVIAHEAAHQWLGNSVALDDWSEIWMNEGFATYLHLMFEAEHYGLDLDETMRQVHAQLAASGEPPPGGIETADLFGFSVYFRGAATLHALRLHAGDETFFRILRAHYDRSAGGTTDTAEFLGIVDEMAGPEAVDLVESWLYDETVPELPAAA